MIIFTCSYQEIASNEILCHAVADGTSDGLIGAFLDTSGQKLPRTTLTGLHRNKWRSPLIGVSILMSGDPSFDQQDLST